MDRSSLDKSYKASFNQSTAKTWIHPEEEGSHKINSFISNTKSDIMNLNALMVDLGTDTNNLLTTTVDRLDNVKMKLIQEKERLQDIILLCNKYTDFEKTINLNADDFEGEFDAYDSKTLHCPSTSYSTLKTKIRDVLGNGYEGNKFVYNDYEKKFLDETVDTSSREYINDGSKATYWEYSRLTASDNEKYIFPEVNYDSEEAKCTLDIQAEDRMTQISINTNNDDIVVSDVYISNDGSNYEDIMVKNVAINSKEELYENNSYIYGSGLITFKPSQFVKVSFESRGYSSDTIAFNRKELADDGTITSDILTTLPYTRRHVISINDIEAGKAVFSGSARMVSKELITDNDVSVIALHCNTYIPKGLTTNSIKYILTINGTDYEIAPVNSHINKPKIIRFSSGTMRNNYTEYLNEKIKSAKLTIIMSGKSDLTPYINNIKILIGDEQ